MIDTSITGKMDGIHRAIEWNRKRYLGYRFVVYSDKDTVSVIPAKHGALPHKVSSGLNTMVEMGFKPDIKKNYPNFNPSEVDAMVFLNFMQFMTGVLKENNPRLTHMAMYVYDRFARLYPREWTVDAYILHVDIPDRLDIYATTFDQKKLEQVF